MNAKGMVFFATVVATAFGLFGTPGKAAAVDSSITIDSVVVTPFGNGMNNTYDIKVTGTMTLGSADTFIGMSGTIQDPNGTNVTPVFISAPAPAQGGKSTYTVTLNNIPPQKGNWAVATTIRVKHNGILTTLPAATNFTVP
jgi:hypothetical protein